MNKKFDDQDELERMRLDPDNYKWGIISFNPKDSRVFLFKRKPKYGNNCKFCKSKYLSRF